MKVEVLYFPGCPHVEAAIAEVERALRETGLAAEIRRTPFSEDAAKEHGFAGSPTILINGKDVEEGGVHAVKGLSCRLYDGRRFVPPQEAIQRALRKAQVEERL